MFVLLLAGLVESALPAASVWPALLGLGMGLTLMVAFGLPPVLQLAQVPPLRVIRRDVGQLKPATLAVLGLGVAGFAALLLAASRDLVLGGIAVGGFAAAVAVFALISWGAVKLLRASVNENTAPRALVLATRQLSARPAYAVVQISSLAVGLLALVLLVLLRTDLIASWRNATPPDAPNRFVINVQPEQADPFQQALKTAGVAEVRLVPHDPGPPGHGQRRRSGARAIRHRPRPAPGGTRVQPLAQRAGARAQPGGGRPLDARRSRRPERGRGAGRRAGPEARRPPGLRHRRPGGGAAHHQPAQGGLVVHAGQLLRHVPGGAD